MTVESIAEKVISRCERECKKTYNSYELGHINYLPAVGAVVGICCYGQELLYDFGISSLSVLCEYLARIDDIKGKYNQLLHIARYGE